MDRIERILPSLLAVVMLMSALNKIVSSEFRSTLSETIGVSGSFLIVVAVFEIVLAAMFMTPRLQLFAGLGLVWVMIGAAFYHWTGVEVDGQNPRAPIPVNVVLGLLGLFVAWLAAGRPSTAKQMAEAVVARAKAVLPAR